MAQTITVKSYVGSQPFVTSSNKNTQRHVLTYTNSKGQDSVKMVWKGTPLYEKLEKNPLTEGQQVDIKLEKQGQYFNLVDVLKAGTAPQTPTTSYTKKSESSWAPNPDKDLSMELGGLMHDAVTIAAASSRYDDVESIVTELYKVKQSVTKKVKDGSIYSAVAGTATSAPKHDTYKVEDSDDGPFPY